MSKAFFESRKTTPLTSPLSILQRLPLTRALKGFFLRFKPAFWWTSINRYHGFSRVGLEKILSPFLGHSEEYVGVSAVLAIFCCRIWHRFMSRLRGERICWVFLGGNSNYRHIYLHTVSYNHIRFLNRSQLFWDLASSGFYSITWRMISRNSFSKRAAIQRKLFPLLVWYLSFLWIYTRSFAIRGPRLPCFHTIK